MDRECCDLPIGKIKLDPHNARTHSKQQIRQIAESIRNFGFATPLVVDEDFVLVSGEGRLKAAKELGLKSVPAVILMGLSDAKRRALALADNKIASNAGWDRQRLAIELPELSHLLAGEAIDIEITGFSPAEIDQLVVDFENRHAEPADELQSEWSRGPDVTKPGDLWLLDNHRLLCGDARNEAHISRLMDGERSAAVFLDPPYNTRISDVVGRGRTRHREFPVASGELGFTEFTQFLSEGLRAAAAVTRPGGLVYCCMDWRGLRALMTATEHLSLQMLNLIVWVKTNAGQGGHYRSQHELIGLFKNGGGKVLNNIELGRHGRNRSNVWTYSGVNSFRAGRMDELRSHPTCKPVAMVTDALRDCTRRGEIVLDTFLGSGTTLMAAERIGRTAHGMELDPRYVDLAIRRWQAFTGKDAVHADTERPFDEVQAPSVTRAASKGVRR